MNNKIKNTAKMVGFLCFGVTKDPDKIINNFSEDIINDILTEILKAATMVGTQVPTVVAADSGYTVHFEKCTDGYNSTIMVEFHLINGAMNRLWIRWK